ncbi:MAG: nuclear transport factor 2 family protein [Bacteroidota bacterium]
MRYKKSLTTLKGVTNMKIKNFLVVIVGLGISAAIIGCAEMVDIEAEKASVRAVIDKSFEAIANQDWETLSGLTAEDWELVTRTGGRWNLEAVGEFFKDHISDHKIELSDVEVRVSGDGKMAWARFNEATEYIFDGQPVRENAIFTAVFEKKNSDWVGAQLHRSVPLSGVGN